ncbi:MAG: hypothetical protein AAGA56_17080 [Myxococcota bacterium]
MSQATLKDNGTTNVVEALDVALELSKSVWKLAMSDGRQGGRPRLVDVQARDLGRLKRELETGRKQLGLGEQAPIRSCYEAGRDGFWLHRALTARGVDNLVVDAASIEVSRRRKNAKTDRLDAQKLVEQLIRHWRSEHVWSVVHVPSPEDEDLRHLHRELELVKREARKHRTRLQSLLFAHGIDVKIRARFAEEVASFRGWDGQPLPVWLQRRLMLGWERYQLACKQRLQLEKTRDAMVNGADKNRRLNKVRMLSQLRGVGVQSGWLLVMESSDGRCRIDAYAL